MYRVEPLSHTADVGFEVAADSLAELFRGAAAGLVRTIGAGPEDRGGDGGTGAPGAPGGTAETLELERPDRERLMVAWLRELLDRASRGRGAPAELTVEMTGPSALRAELRWPRAAAPPDREIKGVTYHGLRVEEDEGGTWHARLVLDV